MPVSGEPAVAPRDSPAVVRRRPSIASTTMSPRLARVALAQVARGRRERGRGARRRGRNRNARHRSREVDRLEAVELEGARGAVAGNPSRGTRVDDRRELRVQIGPSRCKGRRRAWSRPRRAARQRWRRERQRAAQQLEQHDTRRVDVGRVDDAGRRLLGRHVAGVPTARSARDSLSSTAVVIFASPKSSTCEVSPDDI